MSPQPKVAGTGNGTGHHTAAALPRAAEDDLGYVAREFLTWLCYHADVDGGAFEGAGDIPDFTIQVAGKVTLRSAQGIVSDMVMKGAAPGDSPDLRYALGGGLGVREVDLRLAIAGAKEEDDERAYTFALAQDYFDLKRVKLPELLTEEEDDRADERQTLLLQLDAAVQHAFGHFLSLRTRPIWARTTVPALREWIDEGT